MANAFLDAITPHTAEAVTVLPLGAELCVVGRQQGGVVMAGALRSIADHIGDDSYHLRSATATFVTSLPPGDVNVEARLLRRGRSMVHAVAEVAAPGGEVGVHVVAVYARGRPGGVVEDAGPQVGVAMPEVPDPDRCPALWPGPAGSSVPAPPWVANASFWDHVQRRVAIGHGWWEEFPPGEGSGALWLRFTDTPRTADGFVDELATLVLTDMVLQAIVERVGSAHADLFLLSVDHTVHPVGRSREDWYLLDFRTDHAADGFASIACTLFDRAGSPIAVATQVIAYWPPRADG